jgi:hypothetical protein
MGTPNQRAPAALARQLYRPNVVVRSVRDRDGNHLGTVIAPHDGSEAGIVTAAQTATQMMFDQYAAACNVESRIGATDEEGRPKWAISPNFRHVAEIGTDEARYIWGWT